MAKFAFQKLFQDVLIHKLFPGRGEGEKTKLSALGDVL